MKLLFTSCRFPKYNCIEPSREQVFKFYQYVFMVSTKILLFKAYDVFRPLGYQRPVESGGSGSSRQHLLNGLNQGIRVDGDEPLPLTPPDIRHQSQVTSEEDVVKQMWDEAVHDLRKDNKRQQLRQRRTSGSGPSGYNAAVFLVSTHEIH